MPLHLRIVCSLIKFHIIGYESLGADLMREVQARHPEGFPEILRCHKEPVIMCSYWPSYYPSALLRLVYFSSGGNGIGAVSSCDNLRYG